MEQSPEETKQQPAGGEQQKPTAEEPPMPSRPGILKSTQSSFEPLKQASTKTLRFQMDEPEQPLPQAPLAPTMPTPQKPVSDLDAQAVPPTQDKSKKSKEVRSKIDVSPSLSLGSEGSLSVSRTSSISSSVSQSSDDWDSPELSASVEDGSAPSAVGAVVPATPTAPLFKLFTDSKLKMPSWMPEGFKSYFVAPRQNESDKARDAEARGPLAESGDAEEEYDSSTSPPLEDVPWQQSLPQQTLMALLGGLALVFVVSAMLRDNRRSGDVSPIKRQLDQDVASSTINVDENQERVPLPQMPLEEIEEPLQETTSPDKPAALTEGNVDSVAVQSENPAEATAATEPSEPTNSPKLQKVLGKVRQIRSGTSRPLRLSKSKRTCGPPIFTYCRATQPEFYYNSETGRCSATSKRHQLCNRGPNSFSSERSCRLKCVETKLPVKRCFRPVNFANCLRRDPNDVPRWYFDGKRCLQWHFRPDLCPSQGAQLFTTAQECRNNCAAANSSECRAPTSTACGSQLEGAYFAHRERKTGLFRCIDVLSIASGRNGSVCLKGTNRFTTLHACRKTCVHAGR